MVCKHATAIMLSQVTHPQERECQKVITEASRGNVGVGSATKGLDQGPSRRPMAGEALRRQAVWGEDTPEQLTYPRLRSEDGSRRPFL